MKTRVTVGVVITAVVVAFAGGFWPQHRRAVTAETQVNRLNGQLVEADDRVRAGEVLGQLLNLVDVVSARNYGQAASASSAFFDRARAESARTSSGDVKRALDAILAKGRSDSGDRSGGSVVA
jgi:hypothetical protein